MKKIVSIMIVAVLTLTMIFGVSAARPSSSHLSGSYTTISRDVKMSDGTKRSVKVDEHKAAAQEAFDILNKQRIANGLPALKWLDSLYEGSLQRAVETAVFFSHTRPDGTEWSTIDKVNLRGENIARSDGKTSVAAITTGWMKSTGHKENILRPSFKSGALACIDTDKGTRWVQLFSDLDEGSNVTGNPNLGHSSDSNQSAVVPPKGGGGGGGRVGGSGKGIASQTDRGLYNRPATKAAASTVGRSANVDKDGKVNDSKISTEASAALKAAAGASASIKTINADSISAQAIKNLAAAAKTSGKSLFINADTVNGKAVEGRIYIDTTKLENRETDMKLSVYTRDSETSKLKEVFNKHFSNKIRVVVIEEKNFGQEVKIAVKVDLKDLNTNSLHFYSYDRTTGKYVQIENTKYSLDSNGYLTFSTSIGGDIIISDSQLAKK